MVHGAYYIAALGVNLEKKNQWLVITTGLAAVVTIALALLWVRQHGEAGVAGATLLGFIASTASLYFVSQRLRPFPYRGARCLAAFLHRRGPLNANGNGGEIVLDSPAGLIRARVHDANLISVDMGPPNFDPKSLPFEASAEAHVYPLAVAGTEAARSGTSTCSGSIVVQSGHDSPGNVPGPGSGDPAGRSITTHHTYCCVRRRAVRSESSARFAITQASRARIRAPSGFLAPAAPPGRIGFSPHAYSES